MNHDMEQALQTFLATWVEGPDGNKSGFLRLQRLLASLAVAECEFIARPGITYPCAARFRQDTGLYLS